MPRHLSTSVAGPLPFRSSDLNPPVVSTVELLRRQWKWAAFSQFLHIFRPLVSSNELTLTDVENDLSQSTNAVVPTVMQRLLYTLTLDRKISSDNWQTVLRKQYMKRAPESNPFDPDPQSMSSNLIDVALITSDTTATQPDATTSTKNSLRASPKDTNTTNCERILLDQPGFQHANGEQHVAGDVVFKNWCELPMLVKLDSMYLLTEWQFQNPLRLRSIMKDDDETACWRVEPIGKDAQDNRYWYIGADRLWIQRPPQDMRSTTRKRRKHEQTGTKNKIARNSKSLEHKPSGGTKKVAQDDDFSTLPSSDATSSKNSSRSNRAAKTRAKVRLNAAHSQRQFQKRMDRDGQHRPLGTRVSSRLRADFAADGWQSVPQEWLTGKKVNEKSENHPTNSAGETVATNDDLDSVSDLTELSSSDDQDADHGEPRSKTAVVDDFHHLNNALADQSEQTLTDNVIEWETICITRDDWEQIVKHFEQASHPSERRLHKVLVQDIVPIVIEGLKEIERKQRLEEALIYRKRSSRIALKESEKEKAREVARSQAEYEERINRARLFQERLNRAEVDRESRVLTREQRRRELRDAEVVYRAGHPDMASERPLETAGCSTSQNQVDVVPVQPISLSRYPSPEAWELDCEVCTRRGVNQDDGTPMMSCGICSKWQHILCHDNADFLAGRPRRNWQTEDFVCQRCRLEGRALLHVGSSKESSNSVDSLLMESSPQLLLKLNIGSASILPTIPNSHSVRDSTSRTSSDYGELQNSHKAALC